MNLHIDLKTEIEGMPVDALIRLDFDKGEYLQVIKEMPSLIKQINKLNKGKEDA